jgi:hypothetical protein
VRLAFLAIFVAGMYHHVFLSFPVPWILWAAVGLALRPEGASPEASAPEDGVGVQELDTYAGNIDEIEATPAGDSS